MNAHKISVIVPVYNSAQYLPRCINSILKQTFYNVEVVLVDDGSTDQSSAICDEFAKGDKRIIVVHQKNSGVSSARNAGLDIASGEWVTFVDSDDWIEKSMYSDMLNMLIEEDADIAYCDIAMDYGNKTSVWKAASYASEKEVFLNNFIASDWTSLCNVLIRRALLNDRKIRCPEGVPLCEDYHMITRVMFYANKICYVPKPFYHYNKVNDESALHNISAESYDKLRWVNLSMINFFKSEGVYEKYVKPLSWRLLQGEQELVLSENTYDDFLSLPPESFNYIWSCPRLNLKIKIMMWSLSHHLRCVAKMLLLIRTLKLKNIQTNS